MADKTPDGQIVVSEKPCTQSTGLTEKLGCTRVQLETGLDQKDIVIQTTHKDSAISRIACENLGWCSSRVAAKEQGPRQEK